MVLWLWKLKQYVNMSYDLFQQWILFQGSEIFLTYRTWFESKNLKTGTINAI